jgi:hypothetical protein
VSETIKVAHKIGVFEESDASQDVFTDCGIIYVPNRPYILCAFVLDTNEQAKKHISYISKMRVKETFKRLILMYCGVHTSYNHEYLIC